MNAYQQAELLETLTTVSYEPRFRRIEDWVDADVKAELARWNDVGEYQAWKTGQRAMPFAVSRFGYEDLSEGLLMDRGGNYFCKRIRESSAASTAGTGNHVATNVLYDSANAFIGVGDSTIAAAVGQTDLQASSNKVRVGMTSDIGSPAAFPKVGTYDGTGTANSETYFLLTDTTAATGWVGRRAIIFSSLFGASQGNFDWREFAVFNASSSGTMLDRFTSTQGTKVSGQVWQVWITLTLS